MQLQRVAVLGGGPGGLYAARLLKLAHPSCEVVVHEQGEPDTTFGFGVGLAAGTQRNLELADPETLRDILAAGCRHDMTMQVGDRIVRVHNDRLIGIARTELLAVLQRHAEKAGVRLEYGARRRAGDLDADIVIAADGISSATREAGDFGGNAEVGRGLYLWCGADFALDRRRVRAGRDRARHVRHARLPVLGRPEHVPHRDRRADLAPCRVRGLDRADPARRLRPHLPALPAGGVRRAIAGPLADRQPDPVAALPHGPLRALVPRPDRAARRRRAHRPLLDRLGHQARDGGRDRPGPRRWARSRTRPARSAGTRPPAARPSSGCRNSPGAASCGGSRSPRACTSRQGS